MSHFLCNQEFIWEYLLHFDSRTLYTPRGSPSSVRKTHFLHNAFTNSGLVILKIQFSFIFIYSGTFLVVF